MTTPPTPTALRTLGVVVCTHDLARLPLLEAALASVAAQTRRPDELVVMVDGTDALADAVRERVGERVARMGGRVASMGANRGVSLARTRAAEQLATDRVVFLDDDAEADPTWLALLTAPLDAEGGVGVLGVSGRSLPVFDGDRPTWLPEEFMWTLGCSYAGMPEHPARVRNVYGGCAVLRRSVFLGVGGYHAGVGHHGRHVGGGEEADFCLRATATYGGVFAFEPGAVIRHHVPVERLTWGYFARRCFAEGVIKARISRRLPVGALGPEQAFARALPRAVLRALRHRWSAPRSLGIVVGSATVLAGLLVGRVGRHR